VLVLALQIGLLNHLCSADPTDGFTNVPLTNANFELQKPYDIPLSERYSYGDGVHKLWVYANDKPHDPNSHTQPPRLAASHGATTIILRIYDGDMRFYSGDLVTTDFYDKWFWVNLIHDVDGGLLTIFIDGEQKFRHKDQGPGDLYFKCGVYAAPSNISYYMESRWRDIRIYRN
ncbi:hypothetical protein RJ639_045123, partial [Escallonia herrerae]